MEFAPDIDHRTLIGFEFIEDDESRHHLTVDADGRLLVDGEAKDWVVPGGDLHRYLGRLLLNNGLPLRVSQALDRPELPAKLLGEFQRELREVELLRGVLVQVPDTAPLDPAYMLNTRRYKTPTSTSSARAEAVKPVPIESEQTDMLPPSPNVPEDLSKLPPTPMALRTTLGRFLANLESIEHFEPVFSLRTIDVLVYGMVHELSGTPVSFQQLVDFVSPYVSDSAAPKDLVADSLRKSRKDKYLKSKIQILIPWDSADKQHRITDSNKILIRWNIPKHNPITDHTDPMQAIGGEAAMFVTPEELENARGD